MSDMAADAQHRRHLALVDFAADFTRNCTADILDVFGVSVSEYRAELSAAIDQPDVLEARFTNVKSLRRMRDAGRLPPTGETPWTGRRRSGTRAFSGCGRCQAPWELCQCGGAA